jgi:hypothetical protein
VFLLKLTRPCFAKWCDENVVMDLVVGLVDALEEAAVSDTHTPALYASFLRVLVENRQGTATNGPVSRDSLAPLDSEEAARQATGIDGSISLGAESQQVNPQLLEEPPAVTTSLSSQGQPAVDESIFTSASMDTLLNQQGFWDSVLM